MRAMGTLTRAPSVLVRDRPPPSAYHTRPLQNVLPVSPQKTWVSPTLECGNVTVRYLPLVVTPRTLKSACISPGSRLSCRKPSASLRSRSLPDDHLRHFPVNINKRCTVE